MPETLPEPEKLRPELVRRIQAMDDEGLVTLHRLLLHLEKDQLWREISSDSEADRKAGKLDRVAEIIAEARKDLRSR